METFLIASCTLSREDYAGYNMQLYKQAYKTKRTKLFVFVGLLVVGFFINLIVYRQGNDNFPLFHTLVIAGFAALYFWVPSKMRNILKKRYDALPMLKVPTTYKLTDTLVTAENDFGRNEMVWSLFSRADTYEHWVMVHLQNSTFLALDTEKIALPHSTQDLLVLLQQHNIPLNPDATV